MSVGFEVWSKTRHRLPGASRRLITLALYAFLARLTVCASMTACAQSPAPTPAPSPVPAPTTAPAAGALPSPAATPAEPIDDDATVPLDAWNRPGDSPTPKPSAAPSQSPANAGESLPTPPGDEAVEFGPRAVLQQLNRQQAQRVRHAEAVQHRVVAHELHLLQERRPADPRGEAELRVCGGDLNIYALLTDFKRLMHTQGKKERLLRERSAIEAIRNGDCDVVALQGVYGVSFARAQEALHGFTDVLERQTGTSWRFAAEEGKKQQAWNAVLLRGDKIEIVRSEAVNNLHVPAFGQGGAKEVPRAPLAVTLRVPGRGEAPSRLVQITSFDVRRSLTGLPRDPEAVRMQLTEALRSYAETLDTTNGTDEPIIPIFIGEQGGSLRRPSVQILSGALRLENFTEDQSCTLNEKREVATCDAPQRHGRTLFGLLATNLPPRPRVVRKREGGKVTFAADKSYARTRARYLRAAERRTEEIYMLPRDLAYAWERPQSTYRYNVGVLPLSNFLPASPFVWVELNW